MRKIILASTSPRRKELFSKLGLPFKVVASNYEEDMTIKMPPVKLAKFLSFGKANAVIEGNKDSIIISADSFVALKNKLLGKPKSKTEAAQMLKSISDKWVDIITGLTVIDTLNNKIISETEVGRVKIAKLSSEEIKNYIASGEPMDKAGAFAIQGLGSVIIEKMEGDFQSMVGLPLFRLAKILKKFGVKVL